MTTSIICVVNIDFIYDRNVYEGMYMGWGFLEGVFGEGMLLKRKGFLVRICELINYKILCYD